MWNVPPWRHRRQRSPATNLSLELDPAVLANLRRFRVQCYGMATRARRTHRFWLTGRAKGSLDKDGSSGAANKAGWFSVRAMQASLVALIVRHPDRVDDRADVDEAVKSLQPYLGPESSHWEQHLSDVAHAGSAIHAQPRRKASGAPQAGGLDTLLEGVANLNIGGRLGRSAARVVGWHR